MNTDVSTNCLYKRNMKVFVNTQMVLKRKMFLKPLCLEHCNDTRRGARGVLRVRKAQEPPLHPRRQDRRVPAQDSCQIHGYIVSSYQLIISI